MSLLNKASLIQIPSGYKDGTLYSAKPTNGDGDFTFSRGSNLAATRINSDGLIEKGRENLLLQSNQFDTTWTNTRTSEVSGYTGYNGTNDAWALIGTAVDSTHLIVQTITLSEQVVTFSVYAKAGAQDWCILRLDDGTPAYCYFDLSTGTKGAISGSYIDSNITSVGGGWYRLSITRVATNGTNVAVIYPASADNDNTYLGDGVTEDLYIQDAQLEQGLVATDYIETGASTAQAGILEDMPRLDYSGGASCPALLLEPQRTNLIDHSEYLDGLLDVANGSVSYNTAVSPEGLTNSALYTEDSSTNAHYIDSNTFSFTSGVDYVISVFAKYNGRFLTIQGSSGRISSSYGTFNLQTGVVEEDNIGTASIENYGNGWYRCSLKVTATSTGNGVVTLLLNDSATGGRSRSYTGDGTSGLYYYGFQAEAGSYPTSYIPTYGASVTRGADSCSKTGISSLIGQTEGTIFCEGTIVAEDSSSNRRIISISDGSTANAIQVFNRFATNKLEADSNVGGVSQFSFQSGNVGFDTLFKFALAYKENDIAFYVNGTQIGTDSSASIPATSKLAFSRGDDNFKHEGNIKQAVLFKTRLSNTELANLTTL